MWTTISPNFGKSNVCFASPRKDKFTGGVDTGGNYMFCKASWPLVDCSVVDVSVSQDGLSFSPDQI